MHVRRRSKAIVRLVCHLRRARGDRTLATMSELSGVLASELSRIETGRLLPADRQIAGLERAYGITRLEMWSDWALLAVLPDEEAA
jgi:transcriptional regulator with XRE-family HTH domain